MLFLPRQASHRAHFTLMSLVDCDQLPGESRCARVRRRIVLSSYPIIPVIARRTKEKRSDLQQSDLFSLVYRNN